MHEKEIIRMWNSGLNPKQIIKKMIAAEGTRNPRERRNQNEIKLYVEQVIFAENNRVCRGGE